MIRFSNASERPTITRRDIPRRDLPSPPPRFYMGLDLGQVCDYTAIAVIERIAPSPKSAPPAYHLRHLQRFPLGTPYPEVVSRVRDMLHSPSLGSITKLIVDGTGVGVPVVEMLRQAGLSLVPIWITGGETTSRKGKIIRVPKRDLVSVLQVVFQTDRLRIASSLSLGQILTDELLNFRAKVTTAGAGTYEAWRESVHDDLVLALAIAAWYAERSRGQTRTQLSISAPDAPAGRAAGIGTRGVEQGRDP